jgi:hypothetical protein
MGGNLFVSEILMLTVTIIAFLVFWQLYRSRNGSLRKIMMAYFLAEVNVYGLSCIYWYMAAKGYDVLSTEVFRLIVLVPKAIVMLILLNYLRKQKTN